MTVRYKNLGLLGDIWARHINWRIIEIKAMKECSSRLAKLDQTAWGKLRSCAVLTGQKDGQSNVQRTTKVPASNQEEESSSA